MTVHVSIRDLIVTDPGIPRPHGTVPYWLKEIHPLAECQSTTLPTKSDVAIIGSGITALSVASTLLKRDRGSSVTVLEARSLCSGATGRNGGHLLAPYPLTYKALKSSVGQDTALKLLTFMDSAVEDVVALATKTGTVDSSELRPVSRLRTYTEQAMWEDAKASIQEYEADFPAGRGKFQLVEALACREQHGIHGVCGAAKFDGYAIWPYKFVMQQWDLLHRANEHALRLEAYTPVTVVSGSSEALYPYRIDTPRGSILACRVVYCTNAYTAHVLPELKGRVFPYRECMTVQDLKDVPDHSSKHSWSIHSSPRYLPQIGGVANGWCYLQQNAVSKHFFLGGASESAAETLTADDSVQARGTIQYLRTTLAKFFGKRPADTQLIAAWTGVIGRTSDTMPLVGRLPSFVTHRDTVEEWIAAGFNGGGMCMCWRVGTALGEMMMGNDVSSWLPDVFAVTPTRWQEGLTLERSVKSMQHFAVMPASRL